MTDKLKCIFIHGNGGGSVFDHWFPWLKNELEKLDLSVISRDFPDRELARQDIWLPFLKNELKADTSTIIIGHSSGALAAMRYAEKYSIYASVLVGAPYTDLGDENERLSGYYDRPWNWSRIKANQKWILQFHSPDDPYIPIEEARFIHQQLDSEYYELPNRQHFGGEGDQDQKTFPELLEALKKKIGT
ncbi:alpha/beta hydrolase [Candidatus Shapirobacteria bacterium CG_4_10_14_0_2_um_filter_40_12]|uniref:Alpha/beta hydrolase n=1 Tax=Candidatus Shapirobacteria bacterium CG_4_10_14_0_2_um_filter_40_12 TaxID=1974871 RepID=A0A2M7TTT9_9BACT|nr:MAG: alpha/beta hydrolase [Candidatus Shapirobacteria bacterium CG_4_10_14_0_2_um_filter_40_12]